MRLLAFTLVEVLTLSVLVPAAAPPSGLPSGFGPLVEQLGDDDLDTRRQAMQKLEAFGESALAPLRSVARKHKDADVRLRAGVVAAAIEQQLYGELRVFTGIPGWACRVAISPDGKYALSSGDHLRVWDLATGKLLRTFAPNIGGWGLCLSRDGKHVLAGHNDRTVRLFDVDTGNQLQQFTGHAGEVWGAALSADGKLAFSGAFDGTIRVWDTATGKQLRTFADVTDWPRCMALSPDGKRLAVGHFTAGASFTSAAGTLRIWDVETGKQVLACPGHAGAITMLSWSPDGKRVATSSFDKTLRLWDARTGKDQLRIAGSEFGCDAVAFTPDGKRLVSTGWSGDNSVRLWDATTGRQLARFDGHTGSALCVAVTPDGKRALSGGTDGTLRLWPLSR